MNSKYSLTQVRDVWVNARLNAEVDWLDYLEAPTFFLRANGELVSKANQIAYIERSRKKFPNKRAGEAEFKETGIEIQQHKSWATVTGSACLKRDGKIVHQFEFLELWLIQAGRWQIASLCIEDIEHAEAT